jgi:SAM-dependent methyltransferase
MAGGARVQAPDAGVDEAAVEERLRDIASTILEARLPEYDEWLYRYCGELAAPADAQRYVRYQLDHLELGGVDVRGKDVLDAGCGFGMALVVCGLLGARELRGIDAWGPMVDTVNAYLPLLPDDLRGRLEVIEGTVSATPYEDNSFDVVLSIEAISHYIDVPGFISEVRRVLRPGGVLIVSDGNNGLNPRTRSQAKEIWDAFENGTPAGEVHGHQVSESYREKREAIARGAAPSISERDASELARRTSGMVVGEVEAAARDFAATGRLPDRVYRRGEVPVHPEGQVIERIFDPYRLASQFAAAGFETKVRGYWGGAGGNAGLRAANRVLGALSRLTIYFAPGFRLVAIKPEADSRAGS